MMRIVWTQNNLPLSRLIRWADGETVSHVAIVFDEKYVFHSNLSGVHIKSWKSFSGKNKIMAEKKYNLGLILEEEAFQSMQVIEGKWYDVGSLLFWGLAWLRKRIFNRDLPKRNLWASDDFFTCVEVIRMMPTWIWPDGTTMAVRRSELTPGESAKILEATWL